MRPPAHPVHIAGPHLEAARIRLAAQADALGAPAAGTVTADIASPGRHRVPLPAGTAVVRLRAPAFHAPGDARALGAAIAAIQLDGIAIPLDDPRLLSGFHAAEPGLRWTDGIGLLLLGPLAVASILAVDVVAVAPSNAERLPVSR